MSNVRYVGSVIADYGGDDIRTTVFDYDSKNRIVKISTTNDANDDTTIASYTYDDAARTVAIKIDDRGDLGGRHFEDLDEHLFRLDESGKAISGEGTMYFDDLTSATYTDGYLDKLSYTHTTSHEYGGEEFEWQKTISMTWRDGNRTRVVNADNLRYEPGKESYVGDYEDGRTVSLTYNPSWANNPQCNIDLNTFVYTTDEFGLGSMFSESIDLFGKRSRHMISGAKAENDVEFLYTSTVTEMKYDADGFVTKITVEQTHNGSSDTTSYTINYR